MTTTTPASSALGRGAPLRTEILRRLVRSSLEANAEPGHHFPWTAIEIRRQLVVTAVSAVVLVVAAIGVASRASGEDQISWLALASGACIASGVANGAFLLRAYRAVRMRTRTSLLGSRKEGTAIGSIGEVSGDQLVSVAEATRFHRASCPFVAGKSVHRDDRAGHLADDRTPCEWCTP